MVERVRAIRHQIDESCREGSGVEESQARVDAVRNEPWFSLAYFPKPAYGGQWRRIMDFDVRPPISRLRAPVLLIFGQHDRWVGTSAEVWRAFLRPYVDLTMVSIRGMDHFPTLALDRNDMTETGPFAPEYERVLVSWLRDRLRGRAS